MGSFLRPEVVKKARLVFVKGIISADKLKAVEDQAIRELVAKQKELAIAIIATTVSIILTFGTASLVNRNDQKKERKLTALMAMSSIESFSRGLEEAAESWSRIDSIATWMLRMPIEDIALLGDDPFEEAIQEVFQTPILRHDKTAETIFSSKRRNKPVRLFRNRANSIADITVAVTHVSTTRKEAPV